MSHPLLTRLNTLLQPQIDLLKTHKEYIRQQFTPAGRLHAFNPTTIPTPTAITVGSRLSSSRDPFLSLLTNHVGHYPTPANLTYNWSYGSLVGLFFALQLITGILLAMHYTPHTELAFASVEHIMTDVGAGFLFRYLHANGASFIFILLYLHMARGLYYQSFLTRPALWNSGVLLFLLMMATAFIGYVLPWGQMSFWGATVITSLVTAVPLVGEAIAYWVWGGFSIGNATLNRFFSLHYLLPFLILGLIGVHLTLLHKGGSTDPKTLPETPLKVPFHPYFTYKDAFIFIALLVPAQLLTFYLPNLLGHSDNFLPANPLVTPAHIVPEWYFTPFYAILRSCPNKLGGAIGMFAAILLLFLLSAYTVLRLPGRRLAGATLVRYAPYSTAYRTGFWLFAGNFALLTALGSRAAEAPYVVASKGATAAYFLLLLSLFPAINWAVQLFYMPRKRRLRGGFRSRTLFTTVLIPCRPNCSLCKWLQESLQEVYTAIGEALAILLPILLLASYLYLTLSPMVIDLLRATLCHTEEEGRRFDNYIRNRPSQLQQALLMRLTEARTTLITLYQPYRDRVTASLLLLLNAYWAGVDRWLLNSPLREEIEWFGETINSLASALLLLTYLYLTLSPMVVDLLFAACRTEERRIWLGFQLFRLSYLSWQLCRRFSRPRDWLAVFALYLLFRLSWRELLPPLLPYINEWLHLLPAIFLLTTILLLLISTASKQGTDLSREEITRFSYRFMVIALGATLLLLLAAFPITPLSPEIRFDTFFSSSRLTLLLQAVVLSSSLLILAGSDSYLAENRWRGMEYPLIFGLCALFLLLLPSATHLFSFFFCLAGFSLALFVLIMYDVGRHPAREAALKYYFLSTFSSGLALFGICLLVVCANGAAHYNELFLFFLANPAGSHPIFGVATLLLLAGFFFKLSAAPAHLWAADVYEGSPAPVVALFMLPVKISVLGAFIQLITGPLAGLASYWLPLLSAASLLSILWGAYAALQERTVRRFLAYTSINQMGFLLLGLTTDSFAGFEATILYILIYAAATAIFLIIFLAYRLNGRTPLYITDYRVIAVRNWGVGWLLATALFSMAGIPPLAGFFGKYFVLLAAAEAGLLLLLVVGLATSLLSTYYYLRFIKTIYFDRATSPYTVLLSIPTGRMVTLNCLHFFLWFFPLLTPLLWEYLPIPGSPAPLLALPLLSPVFRRPFHTALPLLPALPLLNSGTFLFGSCVRWNRLALGVTGTMGVALAALFTAFPFLLKGEVLTLIIGNWLHSALFEVKWVFTVDALTYCMLIVVLTVSTLVHLYSTEYMAGDPHVPRFISYLSLFTFFMLLLITSNNFVTLFLGWEGVGLCSYLLISFWFTRVQANKAAIKAMIVNRIADLAFTIGILAIFFLFQATDFPTTLGAAPFISAPLHFIGREWPALSVITALLFLGAMGKSAQIGLHTWLPDAMEGPTPVSALIHAATMVTAGVFLLIRCSTFFDLSPVVLHGVTFVGALTAFMAATSGLYQSDLKKVIAYSTCSQLGYMVFACGLSAYALSLFHLTNHAFFKALLFLSAGAVIHALSNEQDMRRIGGLLRLLPYTYAMFLVGSLALMGVPFLTGFYSKDIILEVAAGTITLLGQFAYWVGLLTAFFTAYYSVRLLFLTFFSFPRLPRLYAINTHELPSRMGGALAPLAFGSILFGYLAKELFIGFGSGAWLGVLFPLPEQTGAQLQGEHLPIQQKLLPLYGTGVAITTLLFAELHAAPQVSRFYRHPFTRAIYRFLVSKWGFDILYNKFLNLPLLRWAYNTPFALIDKGVLELVGPTGGGRLMRYCSNQLIRLQTGHVTDYGVVIVAALLLALLSFDTAAFGPATAFLPLLRAGALRPQRGRGYRTIHPPNPPYYDWEIPPNPRYPQDWYLPPEEPKKRWDWEEYRFSFSAANWMAFLLAFAYWLLLNGAILTAEYVCWHDFLWAFRWHLPSFLAIPLMVGISEMPAWKRLPFWTRLFLWVGYLILCHTFLPEMEELVWATVKPVVQGEVIFPIHEYSCGGGAIRITLPYESYMKVLNQTLLIKGETPDQMYELGMIRPSDPLFTIYSLNLFNWW